MVGLKNRTGYFWHQQTIDCEEVPKTFLHEADLLTCGHCSTLWLKNPDRTRDRGWCAQCDRYICDPCTIGRENGVPCVPREERALICLNNPGLSYHYMDSGPKGELLFPVELLDKQRIF